MSKRLNRDDVDKLYDYDLFVPGRTIYIGSVESSISEGESGVEAVMAERAVKGLMLLDQSDGDITIVMNNPGGDWFHGMAIYDAIANCRNHVIIKVYGMAMSMGGVILQAADERIMMPNAKFMMHYGTMGMDTTHSKIFEKWAEENKRINTDMEQIFLEKMKEKDPDFKLKKLKEMLDYDTILTAKETVALGLADKVFGEEEDDNE
jgi:ATP-dependent Clp endopeptidase proteolytic subunit ClpP